MKKNTKKKALTLALVIALLAIAVVGGSLAWFTAEDEAVNTFTVGSIKIVQHEQQHDETGALEDFEQNKTLLPIVNINDPASDDNYEEKIVTVENTGKNDAYIRTWIAIPKALEGYLILDTDETQGWAKQWWSPYPTLNGMEYICYCYVYTNVLEAGKTTPVLLNGVYLDAATDVQKNPATGNMEFCKRNAETGEFDFTGVAVMDAEGTAYNVNVLVATQAVQAEGFNDAQQALNASFGEPIHDSSVPFIN